MFLSPVLATLSPLAPSPLSYSSSLLVVILGRVAYVRNGIITGKEREELSSIESKEFRPWLNGPTHMEPYLIRWGEQALRYIKYPGDLERPRRRLERVFAAPRAKILVNSSRFPDSPWRLYAAVDDIGLFPRQNLYCIIPIRLVAE